MKKKIVPIISNDNNVQLLLIDYVVTLIAYPVFLQVSSTSIAFVYVCMHLFVVYVFGV